MAGDVFKVRVFSFTKRILIVNTLLVSLLSSLCGQNVLIVYYSARGHTAAMARAVAAGIYIAQLLVLPTAGVTPATTRSIKLVLLK